jgi:hypothetical protein
MTMLEGNIRPGTGTRHMEFLKFPLMISRTLIRPEISRHFPGS